MKSTLFFTIIIASAFADASLHEKAADTNSVYVRPYSVYSRQVFLNRFFPHVAVDVRSCTSEACTLTSYGKVSSGKVYSPHILTVGRNCTEETGKCSIDKVCPKRRCKDVSKGYSKKYLTDDWVEVKDIDAFQTYIEYSMDAPSGYNILFNNCATWTSHLMKNSGIRDFSCSFMGIDLPFACTL